MNIPWEVKEVLIKLEQNGFEAYIVGGAVRDYIMNRNPKDFDIATDALPYEVEELFEKTVATGKRHGTIRVIIDDELVEVTTFRIEGNYSDGRHPDNVAFTDKLVLDLSRRDFTINALAMDIKGNIYDYHEGQRDIREKNIRTVGNPHKRFSEDKLRKLRAVRFATQLKFNIEKETFNALLKNPDLDGISNERIREEINKILLSVTPSHGFVLLYKTGILKEILPELELCFGFEQNNPYHNKDIFHHIMEVLDNIEPTLELRLASLLHDIAKPNTYTVDKKGIGHFYGHDKKSSVLSKEIMERLKYSKKEIESISKIIKYHMHKHKNLRDKTLKSMIVDVGKENIDNIFKLQIADLKGKKEVSEESYFNIHYNWKRCKNIILKEIPLTIGELAVNGNDLINIGYSGKEIKDALKYLLEKVLDDPNLNKKDKLLFLLKKKSI